MRTILVVIALCLVSSVAMAGTMSGILHDINGSPTGGVKIWSQYETTYSNADGTYSVNIGSTNANNVFMEKPGYTVPVRFQEDGIYDNNIVRNWTVSPLGVGRTVYDSFDGDGYVYGRPTQDAGAYQWKTGLSAAGFQTVGGSMVLGTPADGNKGTVGIGANATGGTFKSGDFELTMQVNPQQGSSNTKYMLDYRRSNPDGSYYENGEYLAFGWGGFAHGDNLNVLWGGPGSGAGPVDGWGSLGSFNPNVAHEIKLLASGYRQTLTVDGSVIWDVFAPAGPETVYDGYPWSGTNPDYENCYTYDGYFGISNFGDPISISSITIKELVPVPEPGSIVALLSGLVGVVGFARRRRA